ncbi:hypothetical protein [Jeongeupia naejangsanensis]|uniref:Phasin domain-containing protein n=1 Tax=Jeongeupia naejangsanensis TaxID=613195 RepID=A0ABS2BJP1_9NEIS|nr:hypothetical protein [Jeongeupia naejangsanensis]MBM3115829.1 hypothetical protein [Jeongeupia naejangsanensis]
MSFYDAISAAIPQALQPAGAQRLNGLTQLYAQSASRQWQNGLNTVAVLPAYANPETLFEAWALQQAVWQRLQKQGEQWWNGLATIYAERDELRRANTVSKFFEQEYNLYAQFGELVGDQFTSLLELADNIQVDYGYWIAQKQAAAVQQSKVPASADGVASTRRKQANAA